MHILHINTSQQGGAALCAMRISRALSAQGVDSRMLFAEGRTMPEGIEGDIAQPDKSCWDKNILTRIGRRVLVHTPLFSTDKFRMDRELKRVNSQLERPLYLHGPFSNYKNIVHHPLVEWADIIHLHWVPDFVDYPTFFREVRKPIVWTLHDHFPASGIMHFKPIGDISLTKAFVSLDDKCVKIKREAVSLAKSLDIVAISKQMKEICEESAVLHGYPISLINNGIESSMYSPVDRQSARRTMNIPSEDIVFAFCSQTLSDERKGLRELIKALEIINLNNCTILCIGAGELPVNTKINVIKTGTINNNRLMSLLYSCADYFAMPSYQEGFAQTPMEAMACGTPVISFPCSGTEELISEGCGVICNDFTVEALVAAIQQAIQTPYDRNMIRKSVVTKFNYDIIARKYIKLYETINNHNQL